MSLSDTSVPTPLPVQHVVASLPDGTSMMMRHVVSPGSQPAELVSQQSGCSDKENEGGSCN